MPRLPHSLCAGLIVFFGTMQTAHAQLYSAEVQRGLLYPGTRAYDGEPPTQVYSYATYSPLIYLGGNARNLYYMDYLDRADRAAKFGYRMPVDPYANVPVAVQTVQTPAPVQTAAPVQSVQGSVSYGPFGFFRRR